MISTTIQGIPCQVQVDTFNRVKGSRSYNAPSDLDFYGYTEIEFSVFDRKGYPALWLARKMTTQDVDRIEQAIIDSQDH